MINVYKIPLTTFLLGMVFTIIGALFKIMHWQFASALLIVGMTLEIIGLILLIRLILKK